MSELLTPARLEAGFWVLLCGALAAGIGVETDWGRQLRSPPIEQPAVKGDFVKPDLAVPFSLPPPDTFLETAARPLFIVSRRPAPAAPPPEPPKPTMKKEQFILTGVTIVQEGKFAFLLERAVNRARVVQEGKEINGIAVKQILPDRVVLTQFDDTEVLMLRTAKGTAMPTASTPLPNRFEPGQTDPSGNTPPPGAAQDAPPRPAPTPVQTPASVPSPTPGAGPAPNPARIGVGPFPR